MLLLKQSSSEGRSDLYSPLNIMRFEFKKYITTVDQWSISGFWLQGSLKSVMCKPHMQQIQKNTGRTNPRSWNEIKRSVTQTSRPCHFATGWRTERIIKLQCSSSELLSFPRVNCPISFLVDFLFMRISYTETVILHCSRGNSGRVNMSTSLKTVTRQRATAEVFWYLSLHWLHWMLILAHKAVQHNEGRLVTACETVCVFPLVALLLWKTFVTYLHLSISHWELFWLLADQPLASEKWGETSVKAGPLLQNPVKREAWLLSLKWLNKKIN